MVERQVYDERHCLALQGYKMISHISLGISNIERSTLFYDAVMGAIGIERVWTHPKGLGYGPSKDQEKLNLFVKEGKLPAGPGFHLAFAAPDRNSVDRFHSAAIKCGGMDEGKPGLRPRYSETYYAAFVRDPDGHKLEVVYQ